MRHSKQSFELVDAITQKCYVQQSLAAITVAKAITDHLNIGQGSKVRLHISDTAGNNVRVLKGTLTSGTEFYLPSMVRSLFRTDERLLIQVQRA
jgi:hypothetical protein